MAEITFKVGRYYAAIDRFSTVSDIALVPEGMELKDVRPPSLLPLYVEATAETKPGQLYEKGRFIDPPGPTLDDLKTRKRGTVSNALQAKLSRGFSFDFGKGIGLRRLDTRNDTDYLNWRDLLDEANTAIAADSKTKLIVRDADNTMLPIAPQLIVDALTAMFAYRTEMRKKSWAIKDSIISAKDVNALTLIDIEEQLK